ncbi:DUF4190 domain-containing protein [Amycolatopsis sp. cg5]|uniref:DUF4190 domain-containing protein n=1 Tax=Amycolatopsis sp. cg5 TaxID=3238802 RepID=UPI00352691B2
MTDTTHSFEELMRAEHERDRPKFNRFAIAALIAGLLGGMFAALLGIIALSQIKKTGQRGKGFAIAGIVGFCVWTAVLVTNLNGYRDLFTNFGTAADPSPGDCFVVENGGELSGKSCAEPHDVEAFAKLETGTGVVADRCAVEARKYLDPELNHPGLKIDVASARNQSYCVFRGAADQLAAPVSKLGEPYTADQRRFLTAVESYERNLPRVHNVTMAWPDRQAFAREMVPVLAKETSDLSSASWPADVQPHVTALLSGLSTETRDWQRASDATTGEEANAAQADYLRDSTAKDILDVRRALHLPEFN